MRRSGAAGLGVALVVALLGAAASAHAEGDPFFEAAAALRHAHVLDRMGARLDALTAWADAVAAGEAPTAGTDGGDAGGEGEAAEGDGGPGAAEALAAPLLADDLPRIAGALADRSAATLESLDEALHVVFAAAASGGDVGAAVADARAPLDAVRGPLLGDAAVTAPDLLAARIALLLIAEGGVSDGYEEAVEGDVEAFALAWAQRRRAEALWVALADAVEGERSDVDAAFADLGRRIPSAVPDGPLGGDPEDAEEPAQRAVGALERFTGANLYPDRELPRLAALATDTAADGCAVSSSAPRLGLERLLAAADAYARLADTAGLFAPDAADALEAAFASLEPGSDATALEAVCRQALPALDAVRTAVGG